MKITLSQKVGKRMFKKLFYASVYKAQPHSKKLLVPQICCCPKHRINLTIG